ncbi:MAG: EI24 domain-containing protein [Bacteroidetes bacterium]|nr:EI24 domain-containing protein [Bacteroidota bacterium]
MIFFSQFIRGVSNCFKAFTFLFEKGLWPFLFVNLIIWIFTWVISIYASFTLLSYIGNVVKEYLKTHAQDNYVFNLLSNIFILHKVGWLLSFVLKILLWFVSGTFTKYFMLIILSPILSIVSEKTETLITGQKQKFNLIQTLKDTVRGILFSLRNMFFEYLFTFIIVAVNLFFPVSVVITMPLLFLITWYFLGISFLDYNCERRKMSISQSISLFKANKGYACGIGFIYSLFWALPLFIGSIIGLTFGPLLASIGASISFNEIKPK